MTEDSARLIKVIQKNTIMNFFNSDSKFILIQKDKITLI